ncbi:MAG: bifunctional 3-(3-hydroxy-phenyl)propionate/3-hydroxycinnamic acid hydroxylase [Burkholderiaceae bacterium]|nr:bifunctional 3-(3-hydroxy-phenyl)propionate/3-hydroxycinnamic acid hydroxylase [Burkholderiaceae bacterium]
MKTAHPASNFDTDVLLVGLGPVGAAMANLLGRYGVRVLAIDKAPNIFEKPRAIALDNEALRILQLVGVREGEFATVAIPQVQYHSPLFGRFARINSAGVIDGHPTLVTFYQPELERLLRNKLAQYRQIEVRLGVELAEFTDDGSQVLATLKSEAGDTTQIRARYLVGVDGAGSMVRKTCDLDFDGRSFHQDWLIVDALGVRDPIDHVEFICDPRRPTPRMVAPGGRQRWEFMLRPGETAAEMEHPESVRKLLAPWCDSSQLQIERTAVYRFHAREAKRFSKGRCFLAGDAAHITPPFAGQGLVAGLRDAANLAWKLAWVVRGQAQEGILASYDTERRPHAKEIIRLALLLGSIVMPSNRLTAFLVHGLIKLIQVVPAGRAMFEDLKVKPKNEFISGLFWRLGKGERLRAGSMLPQGWVRRGDASEPMLSDDALGPHWSLIGFGVDLTTAIPQQFQRRWSQAGGKIWQWCQRGQAQHLAPAEQRLEALDETLLPHRVPLGWIAIVRPDRCVMAEGPADQAILLLQEALSMFEVSGRSSDAAPRPAFGEKIGATNAA